MSAADVTVVHDRLVRLGATSRLAPTGDGVPGPTRAYLSDPEGNLLELIERVAERPATPA